MLRFTIVGTLDIWGPDMWIVFALGASLMWGLSYSISGWLYGRGLTALVFYFLATGFGFFASGIYFISSGSLGRVAMDLSLVKADWLWLVVSLAAVALGNLCVCFAVLGKNATMAAMIEASYPIFVALSAWLFFNQIHLSWVAMVGGLLILAGVSLVAFGQ